MKYNRQISIEEIGVKGQEKLSMSHVAVIGAGGLGCPVLTYLASSGIGNITIIENDTVQEPNLNRQFLYTADDIGKEKALVACKKLSKQFTDTHFIGYTEKLTEKNCSTLLKNANVIVDCVDNVNTRLLINDFVVQHNIPLVEAGIEGFYGFVTTIMQNSACLRCWDYQHTKEKANIPAIGAIAGIIGSLQAMEAIKIIVGLDGLLTNRLLQYDGLHCDFEEISICKQTNCLCGR